MTPDEEQRVLDRLQQLPQNNPEEARHRAESILLESIILLGGRRIYDAWTVQKEAIEWE